MNLTDVIAQLRRKLQIADAIAQRTETDAPANGGAYGYVYAYGYITEVVRQALDALERRD